MTKNPQAQKLIGGYALGILTDEEKKALFQTALENQEIFNALMDEDILRQILENPEARAKIETALSAPRAKNRPIWQSPLWMGMAASVFLVVLTSYALKNKDTTSVHDSQYTIHKEESPPHRVAMPESKPIPEYAVKQAEDRIVKPETVHKPAEIESPPTKEASQAAIMPKEVTPKNTQAASDEVPAALIATTKSAPITAQNRIDSAQNRMNRDFNLTGQAEIKAELLEIKTKAQSDSANQPPAPIWKTEHQENNRLKLNVKRTEAHAEVVLLHRSGAGVQAIAPTKQSGDEFQYEIDVTSNSRLDLYQLRTKTPNHINLPETGPVDGTRVRIYPER